MAFFNFLKSNRAGKEILEIEKMLPEIKEQDFVDNSFPTNHISNNIGFGAGAPIDIIYEFLKEDYENKAYTDALTSPYSSYKEQNISVLRSVLDVKFKQVNLKYNDLLREIDVHIKTRSDAGLIDLVETLKAKKNTFEKHVIELEKMKNDLINNEAYMCGVFTSYEIGFSRGLASISLNSFKINDIL